jgi:hypothetical protein
MPVEDAATGERRYWLDEAGLSILQEVVQDYLQRKGKTPPARQKPTPELGFAPEIYLAKTPSTGILAIHPGLLIGTGTDPQIPLDDTPFSGQCQVYRLVNGVVHIVPGLTRLVYNMSNADLAGNQWVLIIRDKFGSWFTTTALGLEFTECP